MIGRIDQLESVLSATNLTTNASAKSQASVTEANFEARIREETRLTRQEVLEELLPRIEKMETRLERVRKQLRDENVVSASAESKITALKSHVKQLGESTTLACRHLTNGMNDLQQVSVNMYDWSDKLEEYIFHMAKKLAESGGSGGGPIAPAVPKLRFHAQSTKDY